jgi:subtilisin family serine protease
VEAAQRLGLSGQDTTVCVIDTGIDVNHPNFGACSDSIRGRACRVKFGYDAESDSRDPVSAATVVASLWFQKCCVSGGSC